MKYILLASLLTASMISFADEVKNRKTPRYEKALANRNLIEKIIAYIGSFSCNHFELENTPSQDGSVPLHDHVSSASLGKVQESLDNGAPINYKNNNNLSPLNALEPLAEKFVGLSERQIKGLINSHRADFFSGKRLSEDDELYSILLELINNGAYVDHMQEVEGRKPVVLERGQKPLSDKIQEEKAKWCKASPNNDVCTYCKDIDTLLRERIKTQPDNLRNEYEQPQTNKN